MKASAHFDSIRYFNIKDCLEHGCPPDSFAATDYLPYGYTGLLIGLSKLGILHSFTIILVNCLYLFAGLYFVQKIFGPLINPFLYVTVALLSWTVIKFVAHPLSEMQYIFFSMASLYCFHRYIKNKSYGQLGLSFLFAILTVLTRAVGISLIPALFLGIAWQHRAELKRIIQKNKAVLLVLLVLAVVLAFFAKQLKILDYTSLLTNQLHHGVGGFLGENLKNHFRELGELLVNMPSSKLLNVLPSPAGLVLFIVLGIGVFAWLLYRLCTKKSEAPFHIKMYLLFYALIIFNWPYYDPRFWVPVLPLIVAILLRTPFNSRPLLKWLGRLFLVYFMATGAFAIGYALYTGFRKEEFAKDRKSVV